MNLFIETWKQFGSSWYTKTDYNHEGEPCFIWYNTKHPFSGRIEIKITEEIDSWEKAWPMAQEGYKMIEKI